MAYKDKEQQRKHAQYYDKYIRSSKSKERKKETTRLWILRQRKTRAEQELQNGKDLGYTGVKIRNDIRKRIEEGRTKILVNTDGSIICFHKNEDGHWVNNTGKKKYLHREVVKLSLGLTDEDLKRLVIHHINEDKDDNRLENLEIITQSEHMERHKNKYKSNLAKGRENRTHDSYLHIWVRVCDECGKEYTAKVHNSKYCSNACRMRCYRRRRLL